MRCVVLSVFLFACGLSATLARAADPWKTSFVLPKSADVRLTDEMGRITGSVFPIEWPAHVERIDGQWLLVRDSGAYSVPAYAGWVRKGDMLRFAADGGEVPRKEDPRSYYTERIEGNPSAPDIAQFHWLRGIYNESQGETEIALEDYCQAAGAALPKVSRKACQSSTLLLSRRGPSASPTQDSTDSLVAADACLRLGRLLAQKKASDDTVSDNAWKGAFRAAEGLFSSSGQGSANSVPPGLYLEWGIAAASRYKTLLRASQDDTGSPAGSGSNPNTGSNANKASTANTPAQKGVKQKKVSTAADYFKLAVRNFNAARKVSPGWSKPYYNLGELYLAQGSETPAAKSETPPVEKKSGGQQQPSKQPPSESAGSVQALSNAVAAFDAAIRVDPRLQDAYRERAKSLLYQAEPPKMDQEVPGAVTPAAQPPGGNSTEPCPKESNAGPPHSGQPMTSGKEHSVPKAGERPSKKERLLRRAADSALTACNLNYFRDPVSLGLLAEIIAALAAEMAPQNPDAAKAYYDQAADFAGNAADLTDDAGEKSRLQELKTSYVNCKNCPGKCKPASIHLSQPLEPLLRSRGGSFTE